MIKESSLKAKLRRLGSTPKAIAKELKRRGIKGLYGACSLCPIANFLAVTTKGIDSVWVGSNRACVIREGLEVIVTMPKACRDFVEKFDDDYFPKLKCSREEAKKINPIYSGF